MAKGRDVFKDILARQSKTKVYKNSECQICGDFLSRVQYKEDMQKITCRKCYIDFKEGQR